MQRGLTVAAVVVGALLVLVASARAQDAVGTALAQAGIYLDGYREHIAGVVLEEKYLQQAAAQVVMARELRSDLAVMADPQQGWIEFRDVFEVDGKPVRDRENRIVELFANPRPDSLDQAKRIVQEGARFNLSPVGVQFDRTINLPMAALMFLRPQNQSRSHYERDSFDSIDGRRVTVVRFEERATPRLIGSSDNASAQGRFWIEQGTGRVLRSQMSLFSRRGTTVITASITVDYRENAILGLWLPHEMNEEYEFTGAVRQRLAIISGRALYSNARKFRVNTDEQVAP